MWRNWSLRRMCMTRHKLKSFHWWDKNFNTQKFLEKNTVLKAIYIEKKKKEKLQKGVSTRLLLCPQGLWRLLLLGFLWGLPFCNRLRCQGSYYSWSWILFLGMSLGYHGGGRRGSCAGFQRWVLSRGRLYNGSSAMGRVSRSVRLDGWRVKHLLRIS